MDFDDFVAWLGERVVVPPSAELGPETRLDALELDSLQLVELWIATEEIGMDLPDELFFTLDTLGDLFYYYETKVARA